jgi:hypothetical protein
MAKAKGGGKLHRLPFTTSGEMAALDLKATVYCSRCYEHRSIDPAADNSATVVSRRPDSAAPRSGTLAPSADVRGRWRSSHSVLLPVGGEDTLAFLSCGACLPSWEINHVPIDQPPWSVVNREGNDRFKYPGCGKAVAWRIHGPVWRPSYSHNTEAPNV